MVVLQTYQIQEEDVFDVLFVFSLDMHCFPHSIYHHLSLSLSFWAVYCRGAGRPCGPLLSVMPG